MSKQEDKALVLVTVYGGVAEAYNDEKSQVFVVDIDNIKMGDEKAVLPAGVGFEELVDAANAGEWVVFERKRVDE